MSGLNWGVGDVLTVTKLAWDLYHNCYLVAREAPEDFRQLVNELASLQGVLRTLRDDVNSDTSFLDRLGGNRKETLERCLGSCFDTLNKLQKLVIKYRELGVNDGIQFWRKIKWVTKQGEIADLKSRIMVHTCNISLCMTSIGNSSLARIENSMIKALERQEVSKETVEIADELTPVTRSQTAPAAVTSEDLSEASDGLGLRGIQRAFTGATLIDPGADPSADLTPPVSDDEVSEYGSPKATSSKSKPMSAGKMRKASTFSVGRDAKALPPSPLASDEYCEESPQKARLRGKLSPAGDRKGKGLRPSSVVEAVADAMQELSKVRQKEQSARPLRVVREDPVHQADKTLKERFQQLAEDELRIRSLNAKDWLRVATWWLLKARFNISELEDPACTTPKPFCVSDNSKSSTNQAYADLLKASWILHTIILDETSISSLMTDGNRKLFYNLSDGINESLSKFQPLDDHGRHVLMDQNINIWELLQPEEETFDEDSLLPDLDNQRWITVEKDDAGDEGETVLHRTFVNAAIGSKRYRIKSKGAPYMLILSTKDGVSQPKVTICNQSGTISLTRDFIQTDLQDHVTTASPRTGDLDTKDGIPLNFGRMNITVAFVDQAEQQRFMDFPLKYFNAVQRREPRELEKATETLLFDRSVEVFEQLKPATLKSMNPRQQFRSCDLRILETTCKEGWRTTRRLVVSSSAGEKRPWCIELFLPLSNVRISREGMARAAIVKWSDCSHERSHQTDGNYNRIYTYLYDETNPNVALSLIFQNSVDASDFENTVLKLSIPPVFSWSTGPEPRHVYDISDTEPKPKNYKGILITHTRFEWKYSELFYMYRDTDYIYSCQPASVRFPHVYYTDYISSHVDKLYKPDPGTLPFFSHCEKRVGTVTIDFESERLGFDFMSSLTVGQELLFSRRAQHVATKAPSKWRSMKSSKGPAEVQLWRRALTGIQLLARWEGKVEDRWLSLLVERGTLEHARDGDRASLPKVAYERGRKIDMAALMARDSKDKAEGNKRIGPVTICFESVRDREEFAAALEGTELPRETKKSPLDQLMEFN